MDVYQLNLKKEIINKTWFQHGSWLLLGKFEVFHQGHYQLLEYALKHKKEDQPLGLLLLEKPQNNFQWLEDKLNNLAALNFDFVIVATFDVALKQVDGRDFINYLHKNFNVDHFVVGQDFRFGKDRLYQATDIHDLTGARVKIVDLLTNEQKIKISGSAIQKMHEYGEYNLIHNLVINPLVFNIEIKNQVIKWTLNIPTPHPGNYYFMILIDDYWYHGIIHFSLNKNIDFQLINFNEDKFILDQNTKIKIINVERIIINTRFDRIEARDIEKAKTYFSEGEIK